MTASMTDNPSSLAERQSAFMQAILDETSPLPDGWGNSQAAGLAVYRGNYRSALIDALTNTFERTARYVGESAFRQASVHHALSNPPSGWTIDEAGAGFDTTCAQLFADNPEVAEIAWLEWAMLQVSTSHDSNALGPADFGVASAEFGDEDWMGLQVVIQPRAATRLVASNLTGLWNALEDEGQDMPQPLLDAPQGCIGWREEERPTFILTEPDNANAFAAMQSGASYGDVIGILAGEDADGDAIQNAAMRAGSFLGEWLQEGLVVGLAT